MKAEDWRVLADEFEDKTREKMFDRPPREYSERQGRDTWLCRGGEDSQALGIIRRYGKPAYEQHVLEILDYYEDNNTWSGYPAKYYDKKEVAEAMDKAGVKPKPKRKS